MEKLALLNGNMGESIRRPIRVLQFGEGNFLRAFVDDMIDIANEKGGLNAGVVIAVKSVAAEENSVAALGCN